MLPWAASTNSDADLLLHREPDNAPRGLTDLTVGLLVDARVGRNGHHGVAALLSRSILFHLAGNEDVNDADRLCRPRPRGIA